MNERIKAALDAACEVDGLEIDWEEVERESEEADREAWADLADHIWSRDYPEGANERW